jgi:O-antigen ligase
MKKITLSTYPITHGGKPDIYLRAGILSLTLTLLVISGPRQWSLYALGLFLIFGFIIWLREANKLVWLLRDFLWTFLPPIAYFFVHALSIITFKDNIELLTPRLMFFLVPAIGISIFSQISTDIKQKLYRSFTIGIIAISSLLLLRAFFILLDYKTPETSLLHSFLENKEQFYSLNFSFMEHPTYLGMKLIWVIFLLVFVLDKEQRHPVLTTILLLATAVLSYFLASKAVYIQWVASVIVCIYFYLKDYRKRSLLLFIGVPILILVTFAKFSEVSKINYFLTNITKGLAQEEIDFKNLDQRTREWYSAIQLIKEKPLFGHGFADVQDRMVEEYLKNGWQEEAELRLNAHNQFLEAQMTFGIPGTLTLIWMLITPILFRKRTRYPELAVALSLMMTFFLMFESMFNRQWGIMFFMLFYCILLFTPKVEVGTAVSKQD